jgi:hypothetical protein
MPPLVRVIEIPGALDERLRKLVRVWMARSLRSVTHRVVRSPMMWMVMMARCLSDEHGAVEDAGAVVATAAGPLRDADFPVSSGSDGTAVSPAVLGFDESLKARSLGAIAATAAMVPSWLR